MADHGLYYNGVLTNPVLLAKPKGVRGKLRISEAPVSHDDYPATIMDFAGLNTDEKYGRSIFNIQAGEERNRLFYQYYLSERENSNYRLIEYKIDDKNNDYESFELTDVEYTVNGKKIRHSKYCKTCQTGTGPVLMGEDFKYLMLIHEKTEHYPG